METKKPAADGSKTSTYKQYFKNYKTGVYPNESEKILDFNSSDLDQTLVDRGIWTFGPVETFAFMKPFDEWQFYKIYDCEGLVHIRNPFTTLGQRYWIARCLRDYPRPPNRKNLDPLDKEKFESAPTPWDMTNCPQLNKLRWTTFGYHYDWNNRIYHDKSRSAFPADLNLMVKYIASRVGCPDFRCEACIVNYYHLDSTLCGHRDDSERDRKAPLFSFSFGQSAIFLVEQTEGNKPVALYLRSGDIVVMSEDARMCMHGVPKIISKSEEVWNEPVVEDKDVKVPDCFQKDIVSQCSNDEFWDFYDKYLKTSRININVRQVMKKRHKRSLEHS